MQVLYCATLFKTWYGQHFYFCLLMLTLRCSYNYNREIRWLVWNAAKKRWDLRYTVVLSTITLAHLCRSSNDRIRHETKSNEETLSVNKSAEGECFYPNSLLSLILLASKQRVLIGPYFVDNMMGYLIPLVVMSFQYDTTIFL